MTSYLVLKPLCEAIAGPASPTAAAVAALHSALGTIDAQMLQVMQDFVLLPLVQQIDAPATHCSADRKSQLLDCCTLLLQRTRFLKLTPHNVLCVVVLRQIFDAPRTRLLPALTDELKLSACLCLAAAFRAQSADVRHQFYSRAAEHRPLIAQVVFVALELGAAPAERYQRLRLAAIGDLLPAVFDLHDDEAADAVDIEMRQLVADCVFQMTPKLCATLVRLIEGDVKEPLPLKVAAVRLLGGFVALVFEDQESGGGGGQDGQLTPQVADFQRLFAQSVEPAEAGPPARRTADVLQMQREHAAAAAAGAATARRSAAWLEAAIQRMREPVFERLLRHTAHECGALRSALADLAVEFYRSCAPCARLHCEPVLEMVVVLAQDQSVYDSHSGINHTEGRTIGDRCRRLLAAQQTAGNSSAFFDQLDRLFDRLLLRSPRILAAGTADEQLSLLRLLDGCVQTGARVRLLLAAPELMERLCEVLVFMVELRTDRAVETLRESGDQLLQLAQAPDAGRQTPPWRQYQHLHTAEVRLAAEELCATFGRSAAGAAIFAQLSGRMRARTAGSNEALLVMRLMLVEGGWAQLGQCQELMAELMSAEHWELDVRPVGRMELRSADGVGSQAPSTWFEDRTPGLYESAISVRYTDMLYTPDSADDLASESRLSIADAHHNVQHLCLVLEAIATVARQMRHAFQPYLLRTLYRVLVQAGSPNDRVAAAGRWALAGYADAFGLPSVAELLAENFDFIIHSLRMAMRPAATGGSDQRQLGALAMLAVLLQHSRLEAVPQWQSIVQTVLEASQAEHGANVIGFLQLFRGLVEHLERLQAEQGAEQSDQSSRHADSADETANDELRWPDETAIRRLWLGILNGSGEEPDLADDLPDAPTGPEGFGVKNQTTGDENEDEADMEESPSKPEPSTLVQITVAIMHRSIHYLPHRTREAQCVALETLRCGIRVLHAARRTSVAAGAENDGSGDDVLLPMVHDMWRAFVERVRAGDAVVVRRCFDVMAEMARTARDFVSKRTVSDIFPLVLVFLKKAAAESHDRVRDASFENSQLYHLTAELFAQLPALIAHLSIAECDLDTLLEAALPFLHRTRHRANVQRLARHFLQAVGAIDAAAVYAKLVHMARGTGCGEDAGRSAGDAMATNARLVLCGAGLWWPQ